MTGTDSAARTPVLTFRVGRETAAVPAAAVAEVARLPRLTRVPYAPPALCGVASLRGRITPVVSAAALLGRDGQAAGGAARVIVLDLGEPVALAVDEVASLGSVEAGPGETGRLFLHEGDALRTLDLEQLLRDGFAATRRRPARRGPGAEAPRPRPQAQAERERRLLGFEVDGQLFALPLETVEAVAAPPPGLAPVPGAEAADLGVVALRGRLLPVISAAVLLGLRQPASIAGQRLVAVRLGSHRLALAVDRLHAVLRLPESAVEPAPAVLNRGGGEASIDAVARLDGDRALAAVLSPERLFRQESVARLLAEAVQEDDEVTEDAAAGSAESILVFRLGEEEYGLPLQVVEEVVRPPDRLAPLPRAPDFVLGVMSLRGEATPVIDQARRFGAAAQAGASGRRVLVARVGGLKAGFLVDGVSEILSLTPDQIDEASDLLSDARGAFDRVATLEGGARVILLVDPKALLDRAEADLLAGLAERSRPAP